MSYKALTSYIGRIHQIRYFMPPFAGTPQEAEALAAYIVGGIHGNEIITASETASAANPGLDLFENNCAACHAAEDLGLATAGMNRGEIVTLLASLDEISEEMEPFDGTEEEASTLAAFLYYLSERDDAPPPAPAAAAAVDGEALFETECSACHGADDMAGMVEGWDAAEIKDVLGKLDELSDEMVPFEGTPEEQEALSSYIHDLGRDN
ncbi:MAG: c-type cytochrome [Desulfofustis sp.]